jgi:hypothetical protein
MNLGYDIAAALPGLRAQAESRMVDECVIHGDPVPVWNDATLDYDLTPSLVYMGRCRIRLANTAVRVDEQAGQLFAQSDAILSLPFSDTASADVRKGDVVTITASRNDPALEGAEFTIAFVGQQTDATARRFPLEETQ